MSALSRLTCNLLIDTFVTVMLQTCFHPVMGIPATVHILAQLARPFLQWHSFNSYGTGFMHHNPVTTC